MTIAPLGKYDTGGTAQGRVDYLLGQVIPTQTDYYLNGTGKDGEAGGGEPAGRWFGAGARDLGLAGGVMPHALEHLRKIVDGLIYEAGMYMLDKVSFLPGVPLPSSPICVLEGNNQFIVDTTFAEVYDDQWLVEIEGKTSIRTLTRIPIKKVRVSGVGMAFDCSIDDITVVGRVVLTIH